MKNITSITLAVIMFIVLTGTAMAVELTILDKVSVLMTKSEVLSHLGNSHEVVDVGSGLKAEIYKVDNKEPLLGAGCIYEDDQRLAGQAFIFQGKVGKEAAERLIKHGFTVMEEKEGIYRLLGKDDDTGQPLVVHIAPHNGTTVIMAFEKGFYDRRIK